ncbi:MAG: DUF3817 domain-containing protein [Bacteroidetes bacterium]|nr:DUF3817 domain-containing protein [Bacteroidota bacterium]
MITQLLNSSLGRLRVLSFLEGISLLLLVGIAMPLKYLGHDPSWVQVLGPLHGALFVAFVVSALNVAVACRWRWLLTLRVIGIASFIPGGNFYVDNQILRKLATQPSPDTENPA